MRLYDFYEIVMKSDDSSMLITWSLTAAAYGEFFGTPCLSPADTSFDVTSGLEANARWTADAAAPPVPSPAVLVPPSGEVELIDGMSSGRD